MHDLHSDSSVLSETAKGPIVGIAFRGTYPPGSAGNPMAAVMRQYVEEGLALHQPAAILFDLTQLDYVWGDAVSRIALPILQQRQIAPATCPVCVVAAGKTAEALKPLFAPTFFFGIARAQLAGSIDEGLRILAEAMGATANGRTDRE
jgi:hypothetical protein